MSNKIFLTAIMCLLLNVAKAQLSVGVGCTIPPCSSCIAGYTGGTWTSSNTLRATVSPSGDITGVSVGTAVISYVFTAPGCGSGIFVSTVSVVPSVLSASVSQVAPFVLSGDEAYTYCASTGFTLKVNTIPAALPGATYTWDDGGTPVVVSTSTFAPTYTSGGTAVTHAYTVTVSRAGCSTTTTVNVVVPPSGCSPCDAFIVNTHQTTPISVGACPDCGTLQSFHTIISSSLSATNVADGENYYVVNDATFTKSATYFSNVFYMNGSASTGGITLTVPVSPAITLADCHLFSATTCPWNGIDVIVTSGAAGSLTLASTLIEDVIDAIGLHRAAVNITGTGGSSYYSGVMPDILMSQSTIFNNNFGGIHFNSYSPSVSVAASMPFHVVGSTFTNRDLANGGVVGSSAAANYPFNWPSSATLNAVTVASSQDPSFGADAHSALTYSTTFGHHGIQLNSVGSFSLVTAGSSTTPDVNLYNYTKVGSPAPDHSFVNTNVFDNIHFGVQVDHSNAIFFNNTFRRVTQGVAFYNTINDVQIVGTSSDNTNNRFFANAQAAVHSEVYTPFDFTCSDAEFRSPNLSNEAILMVLQTPAEHGTYTIINNSIYNYVKGIDITYSTGISAASTTVSSGITTIKTNHIVGKTVAYSMGENVIQGIQLTDDRSFAGSAASGLVDIEQNDMVNVASGVLFESACQGGIVNMNTIHIADHGSTQFHVGIHCVNAPYLSNVEDNIVGAFGWNCAPGGVTATGGSAVFFTTGILSNVVGAGGNANIACNAVHDLNTGFRFEGASTLQWLDNQMMRNQKGMELANSAAIGTQGSTCDPADNHWDNGTCSFCSTSCDTWPTAGWADAAVSETYVGTGVTVGSSQIWVRAVATYTPANNDAASGTTPYSATDLLDATTLCGGPLSPTPSCATSSGFRAAPPAAPGDLGVNIKSGLFTLDPNPSDGNVIITRHTKTDASVKVDVLNVLGQQVYESTLNFESDKVNLNVGNLVPGMYQVKLTTPSGEMWNTKVIFGK